MYFTNIINNFLYIDNIKIMNINIKQYTKYINNMKESLLSKLIKTNSGYSSKSFFLVAITLIGLLLLIVPVFALCTEAYYNHTIQTNLSDMAAYIASVAAIFASGGITKAWSEKYERLPGPDGIIGTKDDVYIKKPLFKYDNKNKDDNENNS